MKLDLWDRSRDQSILQVYHMDSGEIETLAEIDLATVGPDFFDHNTATAMGGRGHIAFEVHDNDPALGKARWGENSACRWRNIRIRELL